ncbi:MAG: AI-2E family transporter [Verrucomicrobiota bacterium]|nr:AI-2E family transporter [Verrucomicrobiota bacterium]
MIAVALAIALLWFGAQVFLLLFAGILFAVFLRNLSDWLAGHTPLSERWALAVVALGLLALVAGSVAFAAPRVAEQAGELRQTLPKSIEKLEAQVARYQWGTAAIEAAEHPAHYLPDEQALVKRVTGIFSTTFGALAALLVVLFVGLCLAIEPRTYTRGLLALVPVRRRARGREILGDLREALGFWLLAKTASMAVVGVLTGLGLWLLGVPLVFTLALLAALLTFIPNIGPILAAAPAVLLGLLVSPMNALYVILLYVGVQTVETYVITPVIERKTVQLPPAQTVIAQLLLGLLTGMVGIILAAPLTVAGMVLVRKLYVEDALGDRAGEDDAD